MRFAEIALLALPFVVFVAWRLMAPNAGPPRVLVIAVTATVAVMVGLLLMFWYEEAAPPTALYVPARIEDGRVVPSHVVPLASGTGAPGASGSATPIPPGQAAPAMPGQAPSTAAEQVVPGQPLPSVPGQAPAGAPARP